MDPLLRLITEKLKNPFGLLVAIVAGIGALLGALKSAYEFFLNFPAPWGWIIAAAITVASTLTALIFLMIVSFRRTYRIPLEQRYIFTEVDQSCHIRKDGLRYFVQRKTYLFFRPPHPDDFFDNQLSSRELNFDELGYTSPDSRVIDTEKISDNLLKLYWEPLAEPVKIGVPYRHEFGCLYPKQHLADPLVNFITFSTSGFIKFVALRVTADRQISHAIAYRRRAGQSLKDASKIVDYAKKVTRPLAPPVQRVDEHTIEWRHEDISAGEIFYVVIFLKEDETANEQQLIPVYAARSR
jgi:hypothetical protein